MDFVSEYGDHISTLCREPHRYSESDKLNLLQNLEVYTESVKNLLTQSTLQTLVTSRFVDSRTTSNSKYLCVSNGTPYILHLLLKLDRLYPSSPDFLEHVAELFQKYLSILSLYEDPVIGIKTMFARIDTELDTNFVTSNKISGACSAGGVLLHKDRAYVITLGSVTTVVADHDQTTRTRGHDLTILPEQIAIRRHRPDLIITSGSPRLETVGVQLAVTRCLGAKEFKNGRLGVCSVPVVLTLGVVGPTTFLTGLDPGVNTTRFEEALVCSPDKIWANLTDEDLFILSTGAATV